MRGKSISEIARLLKRNKSTISREINRNTRNGVYYSGIAQMKRNEKQWHKHSFYIDKYSAFTNLFVEIFDKKYMGVKATHHRIKDNYPEIKLPSCRQVFNFISSRRWIIKPKDRLRKYYVKGRKRKIGIFTKVKHSLVLPIWMRPKSVENREEYGHYEIDTIIGLKKHGNDNLLTITERKTRMVYIARVKTKDPWKVNSVLYRTIQNNCQGIKSLTFDNGGEFEHIGLVCSWLKIKGYFCEPYASYQRGSNENSNGLIRRMYKKGTDFSLISDLQLKELMNKINNMPREMFGWKSANEFKNLCIDIYK